MNGYLILNKPRGVSSHRMVGMVRRALNQKRVGHTGTLDPEAEGVLPILVGTATRAAELLTAEDKCYRTVMRLGITTDTLDMAGAVLSETAVSVSEEQIRRTCASFVGEIDQIPPMYSAIQVNGQRLYHLARQGIEIERESRRVTIHSISVTDIDLPRVTLEVHCSKGTYIRTLAADIGAALGCGACVESLLRTASGAFTLDDAITPEALLALGEAGRAAEAVRPIDECFSDIPAVHLDAVQAARVCNGVPIYYTGPPRGSRVRVYNPDGVLITLSEADEVDGRPCLRTIKAFYASCT